MMFGTPFAPHASLGNSVLPRVGNAAEVSPIAESLNSHGRAKIVVRRNRFPKALLEILATPHWCGSIPSVFRTVPNGG